MQPSKSGPPTAQLWCAVSRFLRWKERSSSEGSGSSSSSSDSGAPFDLEEEYRKACRTDSYEEFAKRVQFLAQAQLGGGSSSTQLPSFELLAAGLLEPNAEKVLAALLANKDISNKPELFQLVKDHFDHSARASSLCSKLLKGIERTRDRCRNLKALLLQLDTGSSSSSSSSNHVLLQELLNSFGEAEDRAANPFSAAAMQDFQPVYHDYAAMQTRLDGLRKKTACKLRSARRCLGACTFFASASCVAVLVVTMAVLLLAAGALVLGWRAFTLPVHYVVRKFSRGRRQRWERAEKRWRQSEAVARGTFMVVQDLDTMKRLVTRLDNEVEFSRRTINFCARHQEDQMLVQHRLEQLNKNQAVLSQLLDELEENVYLCFLSINKARDLVVRELCLH